MKKIINNIIVLYSLALIAVMSSCGNKSNQNITSLNTDSILQQVDTVIAIGKVTTENGTAIISSNTSARIEKILVNEGDTVKKGTVLLKLFNQFDNIDIVLAKTKLKALEEQNLITTKDVERENIKLKYLEQKYQTSKELFRQNAETKENLSNDESQYLQQKEFVAGLKKQFVINQNQQKEQQLNIDKVEITTNDYSIIAAQNGIITNLNAKIGQNVNTNESLGEIIDTKEIIIEAEVDELFANKIAINQEVSFININTKQQLGTGQIIYTSPILMNKSILYETANEADDRRVLRVKIKPLSVKQLLINEKVECQIKIK